MLLVCWGISFSTVLLVGVRCSLGGMVNYWHCAGDASYNSVTYNALVSKIGPAGDFFMHSEAFDEVCTSAPRDKALQVLL
jgi:hypothetical protein